MNHPLKTLILSVAAISFCQVLFNQAYAGDYKVEIVIFENSNGSVATEENNYSPPKRMKSGSKAWFLEPTLLTEQALKIDKSSDYQLKYHYAYGVESLPYQESANFTVIEKDITGYVKIYAEQLLFANIDLDFNGFRMNQKRRLKLNERHFFDHPKFGLLMQVSRLEKAVEDELIETPSADDVVKLETSR